MLRRLLCLLLELLPLLTLRSVEDFLLERDLLRLSLSSVLERRPPFSSWSSPSEAGERSAEGFGWRPSTDGDVSTVVPGIGFMGRGGTDDAILDWNEIGAHETGKGGRTRLG